jgi:hypothetical protein
MYLIQIILISNFDLNLPSHKQRWIALSLCQIPNNLMAVQENAFHIWSDALKYIQIQTNWFSRLGSLTLLSNQIWSIKKQLILLRWGERIWSHSHHIQIETRHKMSGSIR